MYRPPTGAIRTAQSYMQQLSMFPMPQAPTIAPLSFIEFAPFLSRPPSLSISSCGLVVLLRVLRRRIPWVVLVLIGYEGLTSVCFSSLVFATQRHRTPQRTVGQHRSDVIDPVRHYEPCRTASSAPRYSVYHPRYLESFSKWSDHTGSEERPVVFRCETDQCLSQKRWSIEPRCSPIGVGHFLPSRDC